jgi:hypothetical protein
MTPRECPESETRSESTSALYLGGALVSLGWAVLTLGRASEWFDYAFGVVLLGLAGALLYRGIQSVDRRRRVLGKQPEK